MNTIAAIYRKSKFCDEPHLDIIVDGNPLSEALADVVSTTDYLGGLIPCLLPWHEGVDGEKEMQISRQRFLPGFGTTARAPILMCPDDCDFWCTLIIAEVIHDQRGIRWSRIGLDVGESSTLPDGVGTNVEWAESFAGWEFDPVQYKAVYDSFCSLA